MWHLTGRVPDLASDDRGREALLSEFLGRLMALTGVAERSTSRAVSDIGG